MATMRMVVCGDFIIKENTNNNLINSNTMPKEIKKQPLKRKYAKSAKDLNKSKADFKQALDEFQAAAPKPEMDELAFMDAIVQGMEQLFPDQKTRIINYLYSRYSKYITLSKLTQ